MSLSPFPSIIPNSAKCPDYIPASHQGIFGTLSDSLDLDLPSSAPTPLPYLNSPLPGGTSTPPPELGSSASSPAPTGVSETIGDALRKALAPNRRDGPAFLRAMNRFNEAMADIQADGSLRQHLEGKDASLSRDRWSEIVDVVHEQAYSRVVGPYSHELEVGWVASFGFEPS